MKDHSLETIKKDQQQKLFKTESFTMESGEKLNEMLLCYETWGEMNTTADNTILIAHALTGSSHAASSPTLPTAGWWQEMIGPGNAFDTEKYFVICSNVIGGCSGSTGPSSLNPQTGFPYGLQFPTVTIRDMVRAQRLLCDHLGVKNLFSVSGGSMGGMQALEWAALYPDFVHSIIPIATPGRAYPQSIAYRRAQRKAIMMDPNWNEGRYYTTTIPSQGIELARMVGFITYRSEKEFARRFSRDIQEDELLTIDGRFEIEKYLEHHGKKLAEWFDANTYLYLSKAMDLHDLGYGFSSYEEGIQRIKSSVCMIGFDSDLLFPIYQQKEVAGILSKTNPNVHFHEIETIFGHDAFLLEHQQLTKIIRDFLTNHI